jgi:hypothetical protein
MRRGVSLGGLLWLLPMAVFVLVGGLVLVGCTETTRVVTFTDPHGRVCTALLVRDGLDRKGTAVDCEYPPPDRQPGPNTERELSEPGR